MRGYDSVRNIGIIVGTVAFVVLGLFFLSGQFGSQSLVARQIFIHEKVLLNAPEAINIVRAVTNEDHIRGSSSAPVKIIEYSDPECPFCKRNHRVMKDIRDVYGDSVAWVYRHHTLDHRFAKSRREAEAMECVAALGGNEAFWQFLDNIFATTRSHDRLNLAQLPNMAVAAGVSREKFTQCFENRAYADVVEADNQEAALAGLVFTPSMIIIWPDDTKRSLIIGARHYDIIAAALDIILGKEKNISTDLPEDRSTNYSQ